tara:strand:- start:131 stop:808 length:678 start_codon:yes stop_codon:yes gene_type:complete
LKKIIIAIDGESSSGKSSLAKALAKELSYKHINTGAMYRALTFFAIKNNFFLGDKIFSQNIIKLIDELNFEFRLIDNLSYLFVNGKNMSEQIRTNRVSDLVSYVSTIYEVRKKIVDIQRKLGLKKAIVMEGRDIGSVVFPSAELKLFITASFPVRVERRYKELKSINSKITKQYVTENIKKRDLIDKNRKHSPLIRVKDSILIDNSNMTIFEQVALIKNYIKKNI